MLTLRKWVGIAEQRARRGDPLSEGESDLGRLEVIGQRGSFGWVRPEHMEPTGVPSSAERESHSQAATWRVFDPVGADRWRRWGTMPGHDDRQRSGKDRLVSVAVFFSPTRSATSATTRRPGGRVHKKAGSSLGAVAIGNRAEGAEETAAFLPVSISACFRWTFSGYPHAESLRTGS